MPDEDKESTVVAPTKEELEQVAHEKRVNEDPADHPLPVAEKEEPKKEEVAQTEETVTEDFDREILSIASELGVDETKARAFSSVADLERHLSGLAGREEPQAKPEEPKKEEVKKPEPIHIKADEDLDEALVRQVNEALDKMGVRYDEKTAALEQTITQLTGTMQSNQAAQFVKNFDDMLVKHGEGYDQELGEGPTLELTGKCRKNRDKILDEMGLIVASHQLRSQPIPSDDRLVQRAIKEVFGGKEKDNGEVEKRKGQFLRRSSSRSSKPPSKQIRARMDLREKLAALRGGEDES